jgi:dipeptidyl aminopeptidase/acylaminoacyl peptidase
MLVASCAAMKDDSGTASIVPQGMTDIANENELPIWEIPNIPNSAEAYYAPDSFHVIAQTNDPDAVKKTVANAPTGSLTYTYTDIGTDIKRINDRGQDACSYFFPDMNRLVWTSTRDNLDMPVGNWSDSNDYPQGADLYISDLDGNNVKRLTNNQYYEAEVSVSPDGQWIVFGRQIDGKMDLWKMRADGSEEQQITFTDDWQEGAPFYLPDSQTIMFRAWKRSEYGKIRPTPMTVFTIEHDGSNTQEHTFDRDMNWAPYPAPDGRHYVFVRIVDNNNWEVFLGDLEGGEPVRLTYFDGFDGFPSLSPDGKKMLFGRSTGEGFMSGLRTFVMDVSSLNLGPENYKGKR